MTDETNLRQALLAQNGTQPFGADERDKVRQLLQSDRKRLRRLKLAAQICVIFCLMLGMMGVILQVPLELLGYLWRALLRGDLLDAIFQHGQQWEILGVMFFCAASIAAIVFGIEYFVRSRLLSSRETQLKLADIIRQLERIAERNEPRPKE